ASSSALPPRVPDGGSPPHAASSRSAALAPDPARTARRVATTGRRPSALSTVPAHARYAPGRTPVAGAVPGGDGTVLGPLSSTSGPGRGTSMAGLLARCVDGRARGP